MAFLYYQRKNNKLIKTGKSFGLAGDNLIYQLWESRSKPTDQGWHVSADDLIRKYSNGNESYETGRLLIDFDPNSKWRIGLIELLDIYIFTYRGSKRDEASWSPMMLRLRDVMYEEFENEISKEEKEKNIT